MTETVNHPSHYGGDNDPFEHIKVAEAKGWGYHLGNATKYLWRMGWKPNTSRIEDLKKAIWYLQRYLHLLEEAEKPIQIVGAVSVDDLMKKIKRERSRGKK